MSELVQSAEFWTMVIDVVVSTALYFGAKYLAPSAFEDVQFVVLAVQPVVLTIVGGLFAQRVKRNVRAMLDR